MRATTIPSSSRTRELHQVQSPSSSGGQRTTRWVPEDRSRRLRRQVGAESRTSFGHFDSASVDRHHDHESQLGIQADMGRSVIRLSAGRLRSGGRLQVCNSEVTCRLALAGLGSEVIRSLFAPRLLLVLYRYVVSGELIESDF